MSDSESQYGRPEIDFNGAVPNRKESITYWELLDTLCKHGLFLNDCAEIMGVSPRTIERNIHAKFDLTFGEYKERKLGHTRYMLINKALNKVKSGEAGEKTLLFLLQSINKLSPVNIQEPSDKKEVPYEQPMAIDEQA